MSWKILDQDMRFGRREYRRTKPNPKVQHPGMPLPCTCFSRSLEFIDPSGNLSCRDEIPVALYSAGWRMRTKIVPTPRRMGHQDHCLALEEEPQSIQAMLENLQAQQKELKRSKGQHEGNGRYQGAFAFTLTSSTKDGLSVGHFLAAVKKIMNQQSQPPVRYAWYLEYKGTDDEGLPIHPHIHGMYELVDGKKIEDKHWRRAWPIWDPKTKLGQGFRGGYHRPVRSEENYSDYIAKDGGITESYNVDDSATEEISDQPNEILDGQD